MASTFSRPQAPVALLDKEADVLQCAACPMCHTPASLTQNAIEAGGDWRCVRCGQRWDAARLATVAAYAEWTLSHDRVVRRDAEGSHEAALNSHSPTERLGGRP